MEVYLQINGQRTGPFSEENIRNRIDSGELSDSYLAWHEGLKDWERLSNVISCVEPSPEQKAVADPEVVPAGGNDAPPPISEVKKGESFGSKLASLGKAAWHETQRNAHLASLKAQIGKAKLVDLNKAHHALGKRTYDLKALADHFEAEFQEITDLQKRIDEKRQGFELAGGATTSEKIKATAQNTVGKAAAEGLEVKLRQFYTRLGGKVAECEQRAPDLAIEFETLDSVSQRIADLEKEYATLSENRTARGDCKRHFASLFATARNRSANPIPPSPSRKLRWKVAAACAVLILLIIIIGSGGSNQRKIEQRQALEQKVNTVNEQISDNKNAQDRFNAINAGKALYQAYNNNGDGVFDTAQNVAERNDEYNRRTKELERQNSELNSQLEKYK